MSLIETIANEIATATGGDFRLQGHNSVGGGCINSTFRLRGEDTDYFVKTNRAELASMFAAEAKGLKALADSNTLRVPKPVCDGVVDGYSYLVMEHLPLGGHGSNAELGERLAQMHRHTDSRFGFACDNTIGSTHQPNPPEPDWLDFYRHHRLRFQLNLAKGKGHSRLQDYGERILERLQDFFRGYTPQPSLLHGDLWGGNYAFTRDGEPVIFDPATYYGDREADIAMTELFGGFGRDFYTAYNNVWPLDAGYKVRKTLYNLYHIINHFNMFGGGYGGQAEAMAARLLSEVR